MQFSELNLSTPFLNAIEELGFTEATPIQQSVFPIAMSGKDIVGISQTGTGKTLAYLLPMLRLWKFSKDGLPQILILVPTRELVEQVSREAQSLCTYTNIVVAGVYGGVNIRTQAAELPTSVDVLVATPGRLLDLALSGLVPLKSVKKLIIDEVDEMLNLGFRTQLNNVFDILPPKRQNLMFSATLSEDIDQLIKDFFVSPVYVETAKAGTPIEKVVQQIYFAPNFLTKVNLLLYLLKEDPSMVKVLVFASSKKHADLLASHLLRVFEGDVAIIHANKSQNTRFAAVEAFDNGSARILVATDLLSRGIDLHEVSHVVNFELPEQAEAYIHRIGRTGRANRGGVAISFCSEKELPFLESIEALTQKNIDELEFPEEVIYNPQLLEFEKTKFPQKLIVHKTTKTAEPGAAFHEKSAKNQKVNVRVSHAEKMHEKYGKPKKKHDNKGKPY